MSVRSNALTTFIINTQYPINDDGTWAFQAPDTDRGIMVNGMTFSSNTFNLSSTDGRMLFVVGDRTRGRPLLGTPRPPHVHGRSDHRNAEPAVSVRRQYRRSVPDDNITDTTTHPPRSDQITHTAYQPYADRRTAPSWPVPAPRPCRAGPSIRACF